MSGAVGVRNRGGLFWTPVIAIGMATIWLTLAMFSLSAPGFAVAPAIVVCMVVAVGAWIGVMLAAGWKAGGWTPVAAAVATAISVIPLAVWSTGVGSWNPALVATATLATLLVGIVAWFSGGQRSAAGP